MLFRHSACKPQHRSEHRTANVACNNMGILDVRYRPLPGYLSQPHLLCFTAYQLGLPEQLHCIIKG